MKKKAPTEMLIIMKLEKLKVPSINAGLQTHHFGIIQGKKGEAVAKTERERRRVKEGTDDIDFQ